jgi:hypothetical protein
MLSLPIVPPVGMGIGEVKQLGKSPVAREVYDVIFAQYLAVIPSDANQTKSDNNETG